MKRTLKTNFAKFRQYPATAFTLVELLVVIAIIGLLVGLLLPAVQSARESARRVQCTNNQRQIALALLNFASAQQSFPAGTEIDYENRENCGGDCRGTSFYITALPYFEEKAVREFYNDRLPNGWLGQTTETMAMLDNTRLPIYICPSVAKWQFHLPRRDYFGVVGGKTLLAHGWRGDIFEDGVMYMNSFTKQCALKDGASKTFVLGESNHPSRWGAGEGYGDGCVGGPATWWFGGATTIRNPFGLSVGRVLRSTKHPLNSDTRCVAPDEDNDVPFGSPHPGDAQFAFCDGHVAMINESIDWQLYQALSTRAGGENLPSAN